MYHQDIIDRRIRAYERSSGTKLIYLPKSRCIEIADYLEGDLINGELVRPPLTRELSLHIENELAMCKANFLYWAERYAKINRDDGKGGIGLFTVWKSQYLLLERMARDEKDMWERRDRGEEKFDALTYFIHKARQLGFTMIVQLLLLHRTNFYSGMRCLTSSINDQMTQTVHARYITAHSLLPYWMQTPIVSREKDRGRVHSNDSFMALQDASQEAGLAQGNQWDGAHLTECASWPQPDVAIGNHFMPTVASSIRALAFLESTSQGIGNWWHVNTELARYGKKDRWKYVFCPWYATEEKWMRYPPEGWEPAPQTKQHYEMVEATSPEFMYGETYRLTREQMYWWEEAYQSAEESGELNLFLANYCATPDESFTHSSGGAFSYKTLQSQQSAVRPPIAYEITSVPNFPRELIVPQDTRDPDTPKPYTIGDVEISPVRVNFSQIDNPKGLILLWEPPDDTATYVVGVDPAGGIPGWSRLGSIGVKDKETDMSAIQVFRLGYGTAPDVQVAEFAAPVDPQALADYANILGRLYHGRNSDGQALMIIEIQPGPGLQTQHRLQQTFGYYNFFQWKVFNGMEMRDSNTWGWVSSYRSVQELWMLGRHHIGNGRVTTRSRWLQKEMQTCEWDIIRRRGSAMPGQHDDRVSAMLFSLWALHDWSAPFDQMQPIVTEGPKQKVDFQSMDLVGDEYSKAIDNWYERLANG
jgi:hypothetical protein